MARSVHDEALVENADDVGEFAFWLCLVEVADLLNIKVSFFGKEHEGEEWIPVGAGREPETLSSSDWLSLKLVLYSLQGFGEFMNILLAVVVGGFHLTDGINAFVGEVLASVFGPKQDRRASIVRDDYVEL